MMFACNVMGEPKRDRGDFKPCAQEGAWKAQGEAIGRGSGRLDVLAHGEHTSHSRQLKDPSW